MSEPLLKASQKTLACLVRMRADLPVSIGTAAITEAGAGTSVPCIGATSSVRRDAKTRRRGAGPSSGASYGGSSHCRRRSRRGGAGRVERDGGVETLGRQCIRVDHADSLVLVHPLVVTVRLLRQIIVVGEVVVRENRATESIIG